MAKKPKVSRFAGKVKDNALKTKATGASFGYLTLPKGLNVFSPEPGGRCFLDFMPYVVTEAKHPDGITVGEWWYKRPFKAHRNIGVDKTSVVCLTSIGKKCPVCEYRAQMIKDGKEKEETDALKPSSRNLYIVIPQKNKKFESKPHILDISQAMFQNLLAEELEENDQYETFPDLEQGYTLKIRFDSKTIGTSKPFAEASRIDFEDRDNPYSEDIMGEIPDLDKILNIYSYQVLEKKFLEMEDEEDNGGVDLKAAQASAEKKAASKKSKNTEPDEEEEEEDDTTVPAPKTQKKQKAPDPEPQDEEEEVCIACQGSGKNTKGALCRICNGTGEKCQVLPPSAIVKENKKKTKACPFDHVFGKDCEKFDHCDDCDLWDECIDEKDKG